MPLFPKLSIPTPADGEETNPKGKGDGYQWILSKFLEIADNIKGIREQTQLDEDMGEFRPLVKTGIMPAGPINTRLAIEMDPVALGAEFRVERIVISGPTPTVRPTCYVGPGEIQSKLFDLFKDELNFFDGQHAGGVAVYSPPIIIRGGQTLLVTLYATEAIGAESTYTVTAWGRLIAEKPQGLAVG